MILSPLSLVEVVCFESPFPFVVTPSRSCPPKVEIFEIKQHYQIIKRMQSIPFENDMIKHSNVWYNGGILEIKQDEI